jgi:uncharacterized protein YggU (UPF0235/DUF167 family)
VKGVLSASARGVRVRVRLTPKADCDRIDGVGRDSEGAAHLKVRVRAIPDKGQANAALEALLAKEFGTGRSSVHVARGGTSRMKLVEIEGAEAGVLEARLSAYGRST